MKKENMAVDLLKEVSQMNTNEKVAFFAIRDAMDYKDDTLSNICVDQKNYTPYQKKVFKLEAESSGLAILPMKLII